MQWALVLPLLLISTVPLSAVPPKKTKVAKARTASAGHKSPGKVTGHAALAKASVGHAAPGHTSPGHTSLAHTAPGHASIGHTSINNVHYVRGRRGQPGHYVRVAAKPAPRPTYQTQPAPERYQEIQQALSARGYFKGEASGEWNGDSTDALKRFQADQKLDADGKINAHTLIGLGLGPKHDGTIGNSNLVPVVQPPPAPESAPPASDEPPLLPE